MPVVSTRQGIPGPVGRFGVGENDTGFGILGIRVAPDIVIPPGRAAPGASRGLEPGMLVAGVVDHQFGDDTDSPFVGLTHEQLEILEGPIARMNAVVIGDVVAVVLERRRIEGQQPDRGDSQVFQVIELAHEPLEIPDAVAAAVQESLHRQFVDDGVFIPEGIFLHMNVLLGGRSQPGPAGRQLSRRVPERVESDLRDLRNQMK